MGTVSARDEREYVGARIGQPEANMRSCRSQKRLFCGLAIKGSFPSHTIVLCSLALFLNHLLFNYSMP